MRDGERLSRSALVARWTTLLTREFDTDRFELNERGDIVDIPRPSNIHQACVGQIVGQLNAQLGTMAAPSMAVLTSAGILVLDIAWLPYGRWASLVHRDPLLVVPDICVEVLPLDDCPLETAKRTRAYLESGATEVLVVHSDAGIHFWRPDGEHRTSHFELSLSLRP
jgi:hypothetical protein